MSLFLLCCAYIAIIKNELLVDDSSKHNNAWSIPPDTTREELVKSCSCWNPFETRKCCSRVIMRGHKFGTLLQNALFKEYRGKQQNPIVLTFYPRFVDKELPTDKDFRHVAFTRNWANALVSAYLYHKAGNECWITLRGVENHNMTALWGKWPGKLTFHTKNNIPYPEPKGRSICTYINEESEKDGLMVIMDFALTQWYKGVVSYYEKAQKRYEQDGYQRVLFLCYEDLVDPFQQEQMFKRVLEWMFPGQDLQNVSMPVEMQDALRKQQANNTVYSGGHASDHDPLLRERLKNLVMQYDRQYFNNTVAMSNNIFDCGERL